MYSNPQQGSAPEGGQFVRHSELAPGCAPLGVLVAGFDEDQLEAIAGVLESARPAPAHLPLEEK